MAVQPVRIARADLRHLPETPRLRVSRSVSASGSAQAVARPRRAAAGNAVGARAASVRTGTQAVRAIAGTPWSAVDLRFRSRLRPAAAILAVVIVATLLGLVYVTQVLAAQNAGYAVDRLLDERQSLIRTLGSQEARIVNLGSEVEVVGWAQDKGLDRLGYALRVKAR